MFDAHALHSSRPSFYGDQSGRKHHVDQEVMSLKPSLHYPVPSLSDVTREATLVRPKLIEYRPEIVPEWVRSLMDLISYNQMRWVLMDSEAHVESSRGSIDFLDEHERGSLLHITMVKKTNHTEMQRHCLLVRGVGHMPPSRKSSTQNLSWGIKTHMEELPNGISQEKECTRRLTCWVGL